MHSRPVKNHKTYPVEAAPHQRPLAFHIRRTAERLERTMEQGVSAGAVSAQKKILSAKDQLLFQSWYPQDLAAEEYNSRQWYGTPDS